MAVVGRFLQPPAGSFFLFGPRGTGKSTWLQQRFPEALRIDLLAPDVLRAYQARPERLRERIDAEPGATTVVVDEVQKAPQLLDVVHSLVEERPELRFVLTGSSARKLRHGAANLLGGRLVAAHMPPFMAAELGDGFHLERALQIGLVPLVWEAADPKATLAAYAALYLQEEVQAEALVRQIGDFSRFLEVISFSQGSPLNLAALAREAEIPRKRAESYLGILEDLLLGFRLPVFQRRAQRQLVQHQKFFFFFFFDAGVFRSLRPRGPLDAPEEIEVLALEGQLAQHLRALRQLRPEGGTLSFWRTHSDPKGLKAFQADYLEAKCLLLSFCPEPLVIDGIRCEPLEGWLRVLWPATWA